MTPSSKFVSFAPVKEPISSKDVGTSSIENTPSPIPARRLSLRGSKQHSTPKQSKPKMTKTVKQPQPRKTQVSKEEPTLVKSEVNWTIDTSNIIPTSARVRGRLNNDEAHEPPSPKRRRLSRRQGQAQAVYSQKWHPIDDTMSPKRALKVKAKAHTPRKPNEDENDFSAEGRKVEARESNSNADEGNPPGGNDDNDNDGEVAQSVPRSPSPDRRRSTRTSLRTHIPNYDMKFHPAYDKACRPVAAQAATLKQRKSPKPWNATTGTDATLVEEGPLTAGHDIAVNDKGPTIAPSPAPKLSYSKILCVAIPELPENSTHTPTQFHKSNKALLSSPPPWSNLQIAHVFAEPRDYQKLESLDRLIYSIQKGAPSRGKTLPMTWQEVKRVLFDHGEITLDELDSEEATEWLKARYESVRLGVEAFFGIKVSESSDQNDWTLFHTERFDVFDKQQGSRYWKHRRLSVVSPMTMRASYRETGEVAETDDEGGGDGGGNQFDIYKDAVDSGAAASVVKAGTSGADGDGIEGNIFVDLPGVGTVIEDNEHTLIEHMRGKEALSSELMMDDEELGKLLSPVTQYFTDTPPSVPHSPSEKLVSNVLDDGQTDNVNRGPCCEAIGPTHSIQSTSEPGLRDAIQPIINHYIADINRMASANSTPTSTSRKRKSRPEPKATVNIHEDLPGGTPLIRRLTANNPPSPGTDIPKENTYENGTVDHSSQISITTPRTHRQRAATTSPIPFRYVAYSSVFGGHAGPSYLGR